jgi:ribonuclease BN (tRNA processing enzyme)
MLLSLLLFQAAPTLAQSATTPALGTAPDKTRLIILGTAGGPPLRRDRSEPANLLQVGNRSYLFDAGIGTVRRLLDAGIRPETISTIFITHHHPDHDLDLVALIANDVFAHPWFTGLGPWRIYGPAGTKEMTAAALRYISVPMGAFHAEGLDGKDGQPAGKATAGAPWTTYLDSSGAGRWFATTDILKDGLVFSDGVVRVYAARNTHYSLLPAGAYASSMLSYSYRVETPDKTIVFTGDTGFSPAVTKLAKGADIIVSEVMNPEKTVGGLKELAKRNDWSPAELQHAIEHMFAEHMTPEQVGRMATRAGAKAVVLTHFVPGLPDDSDSAEDLAEVRKTFAGEVSAAHDLSAY